MGSLNIKEENLRWFLQCLWLLPSQPRWRLLRVLGAQQHQLSLYLSLKASKWRWSWRQYTIFELVFLSLHYFVNFQYLKHKLIIVILSKKRPPALCSSLLIKTNLKVNRENWNSKTNCFVNWNIKRQSVVWTVRHDILSSPLLWVDWRFSFLKKLLVTCLNRLIMGTEPSVLSMSSVHCFAVLAPRGNRFRSSVIDPRKSS